MGLIWGLTGVPQEMAAFWIPGLRARDRKGLAGRCACICEQMFLAPQVILRHGQLNKAKCWLCLLWQPPPARK